MDDKDFVSSGFFSDINLWSKVGNRRVPLKFDLEITARCNNDCRHCYINLSAGDIEAKNKELSVAEIRDIADQAVKLGALWVQLSGGEPLLRKDFPEIYLTLKRKGLLVSVLTNACLVTEEHVALFKKYPPRDLEVTVYGATHEVYERVTRKPGSYALFRRGLDLLLQGGLKVRLKAMVVHSNMEELPAIAAFCRERTCDYFRFDPLLHLRYDQDPLRNAEIIEERLSPEEIVAVEHQDDARARSLEHSCNELIGPSLSTSRDALFYCGAGSQIFAVNYDGTFQLCTDLWHPETIFDLRKGSLAQAWNELIPRVWSLRPTNPDYSARCGNCPIINLCLYCPAHAYLECGQMDGWSDYFCQVAHARAKAISVANPELHASIPPLPDGMV